MNTQTLSTLSAEDEARLTAQRAVITRYVAADEANLARYATAAGKLGLLRALLAKQVFGPTQTYELQCMGIVLGDAFVQQCGWLWRMVSDEYGRDPCLKIPGSSILIFPLTMISKRIERGEEVDVLGLFDLVAEDTAERLKTADPQPD